MGNVYIFNATVQELTLTINEVQTDKKLPPMKATADGYTFGTMTVPRTEDAKPRRAVFGDENTLRVTRKQGSDNYQVDIDPDQHPLEQDVQMVIFYKGMVYAINGVVLKSTFTAGPAAEIKELLAAASSGARPSNSGAAKSGAAKSGAKKGAKKGAAKKR
ncbi:MAG TPA: hypothetical protein VF621_05550 [Pyrinomonadaceae bacterium]|jgi:hypothetical protein